MRSAKAPQMTAGVMMAKVIWKVMNTDSGAAGESRPRSPAGGGWHPGVIVVGALLALLVIPPLWFLLQGSVFTTTPEGGFGDFTFDYYRKLAGDRRFFTSLSNSATTDFGALAARFSNASISR